MPKVKGSASAGRGVAARPKVCAAKGYRHPDPLPPGEILTDVCKRKWTLGTSIGIGGFGEIYTARDDSKNGKDEFVIKIEPHDNGPLFVESHFYARVGDETVSNWMTAQRLQFLGLPQWYGNGQHVFKDTKYRFLVIQRLGTDIQKKIENNGGRFSAKSVFMLGLKILDVLEFIHNIGYVHNDVKAGNLLLAPNDPNQVYLVDFGICCRYVTSEGKVKEYKKDPKSAHDGTLIYTSRDGHDGASYSRRGDLEILGYNMVHWLTGSLPWENTKSPASVMEQKHKFMQSLSQSGKQKEFPDGLIQYFVYIRELGFTEAPDYSRCRKLFEAALKQLGVSNDGKLKLDDKSTKSVPVAKKGRKLTPRQQDDDVEVKKCRRSPRKLTNVSDKSRNGSRNKPVPDLNSMEFDNPTPAMRKVMAQLQQQQQSKKVTKPNTRTSSRRNGLAEESVASPNGTCPNSHNISPDLF